MTKGYVHSRTSGLAPVLSVQRERGVVVRQLCSSGIQHVPMDVCCGEEELLTTGLVTVGDLSEQALAKTW